MEGGLSTHKLPLNVTTSLSDYSTFIFLQVNELYSTIQKYSTESDKLVQQRDKQITALQQQLEDSEKAKVCNIVYVIVVRLNWGS